MNDNSGPCAQGRDQLSNNNGTISLEETRCSLQGPKSCVLIFSSLSGLSPACLNISPQVGMSPIR
jgi:hypothetical protein